MAEKFIRFGDMSEARRWSRYRRDALAQKPIRSVLPFRLFLERFDVGADRAVEMLKRLSRESNTSLAAVAERPVHFRGRP
ncbi:hypothetical protein BH09ACT8_BH09ACT8_32070 [soil metagenome]